MDTTMEFYQKVSTAAVVAIPAHHTRVSDRKTRYE